MKSTLSLPVGRQELYWMVVRSIVWVVVLFLLSYSVAFSVFGVGRDYNNYSSFYSEIGPRLDLREFRYEPGFVLFAWMAKNVLGFDFRWFLFVATVLALGIKIWLINRHTKYPLLVFFVYALVFMPIFEHTQIRLAVGISFSYFGLLLFVLGRRRSGLVGMVFGVLFHYTLVLIIVFGLLHWILSSGKLLLSTVSFGIVSSLAVLVVFLYSDSLLLLNPLLANYVELADEANVPVFFSVFNMMLMLPILVLLYSYIRFGYDGAGVFYWMSVASLICFLFFTSVPVVAQRLRDLLGFSILFWFSCFGRWRLSAGAGVLFVVFGAVGVFLSYVRQGIIFAS